MAEQSNRPLVSPERKGLSSKKMGRNSAVAPISLTSGRITRRSLTGSCDIGDNTRRSSSERPDSSKIVQCRIPRYLRASTGSCHDLCKYGRRRAFEEKVIKPIRKRTTKPSKNELKSIEIIVSGEQTKEKVVKQKPSVDTEKSSLIVKPSPDAKSFLSKVEASSDAKTPRRLDASSRGKTLLPNLPAKKAPSPETPHKARVREGIDNKMSRGDKKRFDRRSSFVRSKLVKVNSSSASENSDGRGRRIGGVQTGRKMRASIVSAKKTTDAPLIPKGSLSRTADKARKSGRVKLSPGKDQNWIDRVDNGKSNGQVFEKTLHAIETGPMRNPLESRSSSVSLSHANPSPLFNEEEDDRGIKYSGDETDEFSSELEIGHVKSVVENHNSLEMETGKNASESIPDYHANPSPVFRDEKIEYGSNDVDEFDINRSVSMEIDKVHVKEHHHTALRMETESSFKSNTDGDADVIPSPPSPKSLEKSPSLLSDEEEIKNMVKEADKLASGDSVTVKFIKTNPLKRNHNKTLKKIRMVSSGDKYCRPVKFKFRGGKVVELHQDSVIPKRLIFRKLRLSGSKPDVSVSGNVQPVKESNKNLYNITLRKSRVVFFDDKSRSPVRLFRSEKGGSLQSESNIPWRIKFRRARILGIGNGKSEFKRVSKTDAAGVDLSSRKVNLKHQDLQETQDAQCLFNNVIEETASKLVESRKSKVKALVGAFETVISLQERKPSFHTAS